MLCLKRWVFDAFLIVEGGDPRERHCERSEIAWQSISRNHWQGDTDGDCHGIVDASQ